MIFILLLIMWVATYIRFNYVVDLSKSSMLIIIVSWFIFNLITDKKEYLETESEWYKNKWGILEFFLLIILITSLPAVYLFVIDFNKFNNSVDNETINIENDNYLTENKIERDELLQKKAECIIQKAKIMQNNSYYDSIDVFYNQSLDSCLMAYIDYVSSDDDTHYISRHTIKNLSSGDIIYQQTNYPEWEKMIEELKRK